MIIYAINYGLCVIGPEMAMDFDRAAHGQPTARLGTVKNNWGLLDWTENGPCVL